MSDFSASSYRHDIQGLRGIAVAAVVIFHAYPALLPGGFAGVDIFFVISGFLIGGILRRDMEAGEFGLADFYRKRVRRIFPALFAMLLAVLLAGGLLLGPAAYKELARTSLSSALFVSNLDFYAFSGYFDPAAELRPLLHTWSLSVEEQFYLLFPLLLWAVLRFAPRQLLAVMLALAVLSLIASQWMLARDPMAAYFLAPFRGFELLAGVIAAYLPKPARRAEAGGLAGLLLIGASLIWLDPAHAFPGVLALVPSLGAALVLWGGLPRGPERLLCAWPLLALGAISYSLYLWHWPIMAFLRILSLHAPSTGAMALALLASVIAGALSWRYIEMPFARARLPRSEASGAPILRAGLIGLAVVALLSAGLWRAKGLPERFALFPAHVQSLFAGAQDFSPWRAQCHQQDHDRRALAQACKLGPDERAPRLLVWGDSHGAELAAALATYLPLRQITASACPPVLGVAFPARPNCKAVNARLLAEITADPALTHILLTLDLPAYPSLNLPELAQGYRQTVRALVDAGKQPVLLGQIPDPMIEVPQVAGILALWGQDTDRLGFSPALSVSPIWRQFQQDLARAEPAIRFYDPAPALCAGQHCPLSQNGQALYFNASHISMAGAARIAPDLARFLASAPARYSGTGLSSMIASIEK